MTTQMPSGAVDDGNGGWWTDARTTSWFALPKCPLPADLAAEICGAHHSRGFVCSEDLDHGGMHVSGASIGSGEFGIVAVWQ